jgi:hypothetical protein
MIECSLRVKVHTLQLQEKAPPGKNVPAAIESDFKRLEGKCLFRTGYATGSAADAVSGIFHEHEHACGIFFIDFFEAEDIAGAGLITATAAKTFFVVDILDESGGPGTSVFGFSGVVSHSVFPPIAFLCGGL